MLNSLRLGFGAIGLTATGVWMLSGSAQETYNFDLPASTVIERLGASHRTVEGTGMGSLTVSGEGQFTVGQVKIAIKRAGNPGKLFCTVEIDATSPTASQAALDCEQSGSAKSQLNALGGEALKIVVHEHVLASVLGRPYNTDKVANQMIAFMARSAPAMVAAIEPPESKPSEKPQRSSREDKARSDFYNNADADDGTVSGDGAEADAGMETEY